MNQIISFLVSFGLPITRISKDFSLSRSTIYRIIKDDLKQPDPLEEKIKDIALRNPSFGYRRIFALLKQDGISVNHKKAYRIYTSCDLQRPLNVSNASYLSALFSIHAALVSRPCLVC
ncbi:MAG: IS3 family transposase [Athalassotoga sp.]